MKQRIRLLVVMVLGFFALVPFLSQQVFASSELITHWRFDELTAGSTALDSSSSGFNGTPYGRLGGSPNPSFVPQPSTDVPAVSFNNPRSLFFQGDGGSSTGSYIDVSDWSVDTSNGFTVSLWAKPMTTPGSSWERFIDFGNGPANENIVFAQNGSTNQVFFEVYNGSNTTKIIAPSGSWKTGSWHYYAATIDGSGNATIYIDGDPVATGTTNKPLNLTRSNKYVGKSNWGDNYYEGYMDDVRFYSRALTQQEVQGLTDGESGPGVADNNGLDEGVEDAGPNGGDANNDAVLDSQQANVASFVTPVTNKYLSVEAPSGCTLSSLSAPAASSNAVSDTQYEYPAGFVNYTASCGTLGYTATITLYVYGLTQNNLVLRKYNPASHVYSTVGGAVISQVTIDGQVATKVLYQVTDGGTLDTDGTLNGTIVDPVGLAVSGASAQTGTLANAGLKTVLFTGSACLLIVSAIVVIRVRRSSSRGHSV